MTLCSRRRFLQVTGVIGIPLVLSGCDLLREVISPPAPTPPPSQVQQVEVTLTEWQILPVQIAVKAGRVRFVVHNAGTTVHGFEIEGVIDGRKFEEEIEPFPAGQTRTLEVELTPSRYEIYCQVPGHRELGMEGELIVEEEAL